MWSPQLNDLHPAARLGGAAVICSVLTQRLFSRQSELCSETLSWILLPILFRMTRRLGVNTEKRSNPRPQHSSSRSLWIVATSLAISSIYIAEIGIVAFSPALSPILLLAQKRFRPDLFASGTASAWFLSPLGWGMTLSALLATFTLSNGNIRGASLSTVAVAGQLLVYLAFLPRSSTSLRLLPLINDIEEAIIPLSWRAVSVLTVALGAQTMVFGFTSGKVVPTLLLGLAKALSWYFIVQTTRFAPWCIATTIGTFSIMSTRDPFAQSSGAQALLHMVASILALSQVVYLIPKKVKSRSILWMFSLVPLVPYVANIWAIRSAHSEAQFSFNHFQEHPVEVLVNRAKTNFHGLLQNQSKNYTAACSEYRRRYGAEPPNGFESWYTFATSHQSLIIDEFDVIYNAVSPFWKLSGNEVLGMMNDVQAASDSELWLCVFSSNSAKTHCSHPHRTFDRHIELLFNKLLGDLRLTIPDVKFLVNHLDEPRVRIPPPLSEWGRDNPRNDWFHLTNTAHQPVWNALTIYCASQRQESSVNASHGVETYTLPFVMDPFSPKDLCQHQEYRAMHGLVMNPTSFRLIEGLVPILSTGALSTMGDILYPSPAYSEAEFQYNEAHDIEWNKKRNNLYWAGSTTGGFAVNEQWRHHHRQRFVTLAQNLQRMPHSYLREIGGVVKRVRSTFLNTRLFDVAFTRVFQCERKYCRDQKAYFKVKAWANKDQALQSRLALDIDGNGISGRYYQLLASRSVPLKQTLFREWHDDRLAPWVHYIPVSQGMEEVPELVTYLTSNIKGQKIAEEIADQGRDWFSKAFREVDQSIYTYRLLLELARLQDPERQAS